jgi:hypothetical protein
MESGTALGRPLAPESEWKNICLECLSIFGQFFFDLDSVQNSEVEAVPIVWDSELSINGSVSPVISFISGDILTMFDRTTNQVKVVVEMKAVWTMQITYRRRRQRKSKSLRNREGWSAKGFHANLQTHWMGVYVGKSLTVHWTGYSSANKLVVRHSG